MALRELVDGIYRTYCQSVFVLSAYTKDIDRAIQVLQANHIDLVTKLVAARNGESNAILTPPDSRMITVDESLVDELIEAMKVMQGHKALYPTLSLRMSFINLMALFDAYLSDIFETVAKSKPEILRSKKQLTYEKVLEFSKIEDLVNYLAKRELNELSYKSIKDQLDYYRDRFGLNISACGVSVETLTELRARRNLFVHNNGVVNHIYLDLVPNAPYASGDLISVDSEYFENAVRNLGNVALFTSDTLTEKYG